VPKAEQVFEQLSARVGEPVRLPGAPAYLGRPEYAVVTGLLLLAAEQRRHAAVRRPPSGLGGLVGWIKGLFKDA
jgi:hypothetical protein